MVAVGSDALATVLASFERGELAGVVDRFAPDAVYHEPRKPPIRGRDAIAAEFARFAATGVPFRMHVDDVIENASGACVVYRFAVRGGEDGAWRERAGCAVVRLDDRGQIAEWREYEG
ncbi:MAG TPA: nuclear transport factor 2 family protein [Candidatus Elarobacter sp.]|nr:nuclear transport factor 2 family protein [Candidatus Elarobacter sp.]